MHSSLDLTEKLYVNLEWHLKFVSKINVPRNYIKFAASKGTRAGLQLMCAACLHNVKSCICEIMCTCALVLAACGLYSDT